MQEKLYFFVLYQEHRYLGGMFISRSLASANMYVRMSLLDSLPPTKKILLSGALRRRAYPCIEPRRVSLGFLYHDLTPFSV